MSDATKPAPPVQPPTKTEPVEGVAPQTGVMATPKVLTRVGPMFVIGLVFATFGVMLALILPSAFSLSLAIERIAPGREEILGWLSAAGSIAALVTGPLVGVLSDRTRSRLGRRRPFMLGGLAVGLLGLVVLGLASSVALLHVGWILTQLGWGTATASLLNVQADRLPAEQRGRVAGLTGFATMVAPTVGVALASGIASNLLLLFVLPGVVGGILLLLFAIFYKDADSRGLTFERLTFAQLGAKYVFDPRKHPPYAWNWLGRLMFFLGISSTTTFTTFFFAQRLDIPLSQLASELAFVSLIGIIGITAGAIGGGFLSDRLGRRRVFIVVGAVGFAIGSVITALAPDLLMLIAGSLVMNLAIGVFTSVDQAIVLDILPERDTDAGRYMALMGLSQGIPNIVAPLIAGVLITIGTAGEGKNYAILYWLAGVFVLAGALIIYLRVKTVR
ncbi:MFS family permease [Kibdelosporangium banguiense]|uniref:MFS family permease n=1 Tax=Kibdelosporangium banguiense TaxID=1365924 RepID=A0ABS4TX92_9PSEU|nr:MFS transporter [Kibdelosporangium banguiense]MBP2328986.1 MFS family permease [Kibdelosporangium banguiense]